MAYSPPNTFVAGNLLTASALKGNDDALKVYLHEGIVSADLRATAWVETRHVQAPVIDAFAGVQHGITGFPGSQWDGGALVRCQFGTGILTGKRYGATTKNWEIIPQTTFTLGLRKSATILFHWWMESANGPDNGQRSLGSDAYMWVSEYTSSGLLAGTGLKSVVPSYSQEAKNNHQGFSAAGNPPAGPAYPYTLLGWGNMSGTALYGASDTLTVGLVHLSTIDRSAVLNWGIAIEAYYLK